MSWNAGSEGALPVCPRPDQEFRWFRATCRPVVPAEDGVGAQGRAAVSSLRGVLRNGGFAYHFAASAQALLQMLVSVRSVPTAS